MAGSQGARVLGALDPLADGQQRGELVAAPAASASPVQRARLERMIRVSGCSGPWTRSRTGSSAASWSRAPAASASLLSRGDAEAVGDFAQAQLLAAQVEGDGEHGVVGDGRASDCLGFGNVLDLDSRCGAAGRIRRWLAVHRGEVSLEDGVAELAGIRPR